jgi:hypothetical protein
VSVLSATTVISFGFKDFGGLFSTNMVKSLLSS